MTEMPLRDDDAAAEAIEARVRLWYESTPAASAASEDRIKRPLRATPSAQGARRAGRAGAVGSVGWRAAAGLAIFLVGLTAGITLRTGPDGDRRHTFMIAAPSAGQVSLVGDFNQWDGRAAPMELDRTSGRWRIELPLPPGAHSYAYIVDGREWVVDPQAPIAADQDLGTTNQLPSERRR